MIAKTLARSVCAGLLALMAIASSETPDRSRMAVGSGARPVVEGVEASDEGVFLPTVARSSEEQVPVPSCSDAIDKCNDPVKHLGTQKECACFACGYGTPGQRTVCTNDSAAKAALFKRAR